MLSFRISILMRPGPFDPGRLVIKSIHWDTYIGFNEAGAIGRATGFPKTGEPIHKRSPPIYPAPAPKRKENTCPQNCFNLRPSLQ